MKETLNSRVAVLETQVDTINSKLDEVKADIKEVHNCLHKTRELILAELKTLRQEENAAHDKFNDRLVVLENWRWYILGIAAAVGVAVKFIF